VATSAPGMTTARAGARDVPPVGWRDVVALAVARPRADRPRDEVTGGAVCGWPRMGLIGSWSVPRIGMMFRPGGLDVLDAPGADP
jgi:hypothetical protein